MSVREPAGGHQWFTVTLRLPDGALLGQQFLAVDRPAAERRAREQYPGAVVVKEGKAS